MRIKKRAARAMCNPCVEQGMMKEKSLNKVANKGGSDRRSGTGGYIVSSVHLCIRKKVDLRKKRKFMN